jgi:hypothetical protein
MKTVTLLLFLFALGTEGKAQKVLTPFERSDGKRTATYFECIDFYKKLAAADSRIRIDTAGAADAAYPLHLVLWCGDKRFDPATWNRNQKVVVLVNNGIHPGEPDGIDASMMLLRDAAEGRVRIPDNVVLAVIPLYNIGGALNRNNSTRVNQVGPEQYGFRGNGQNLDLNRDFTKRDSRESRAFARLFHRLDPAIFIDNHVSDGADYQHAMTLLSSQYDKLGGVLGTYFRDRLDPLVFSSMAKAGWPMVPYVNAEETPEKGWTAFMDPPRFSSGYAALFGCIAWVPESHMLKPFDQRVAATYAFMKVAITTVGQEGNSLLAARKNYRNELQEQAVFPMAWKDSAVTMWPFKGYASAYRKSEVTGEDRLYYDHKQPINVSIPIRDHFAAAYTVKAPEAYILPQGWEEVADRLREDNVYLRRLDRDTVIDISVYTIDSFKTSPNPYEKHYKHSGIHVSTSRMKLKCRKGDYLIPTHQRGRRFIIEMLEPTGEDSYFAWNYFDAVLQRKEGYSDYRWEDVAAQVLRDHPEVRTALEQKKKSDPAFGKDAAAQLFYVYQHSRWYEAAHMRYPVYRIEQ